jgi:hypothetical protein
MMRTRWVLAAAVIAALVSGAQAQRQPGGQSGGRGGFGLQQPLAVVLLTNADLQKELKITDEQKKAFKDSIAKLEEFNKKQQEAFSGGGFDREAFQKMNEDRQKMNSEIIPAVEKALNDDQKKRMKQIDVQRMGLFAFANEDVVKTLKITDEQKDKLKSITDDSNMQLQALRQEYGIRGFGGFGGGGGGAAPDPEKLAEFTKKSKVLTDETMEKVMKAMTDDQKKAWKEMVGETFDVTKLQVRPMRRDN